MNRSFLAGGFLPGHSSAYNWGSTSTAGDAPPLPDDLNRRRDRRNDQLRNRRGFYTVRLQASVALSLLVTVGAFRLQYRPSTQFEIAEAVQQVVVMEEIVQTDHIAKPPPPPRPPVPIEVPNDELIEEVALDLDAEIDLAEALEVPPPPPPPPVVEEEPEPDIFIIVEDMPEMVGGLEKLYQDLLYPELAMKAGIEGQVVIQIVILEDGTPSSPTVLRSAGDILNKAAIRALMAQRFRPGKQRGRAVRVQMAFPITFRLTDGSPA